MISLSNMLNAAMILVMIWAINKYLNIFFQKKAKVTIFTLCSWLTFFGIQIIAESKMKEASLLLLLITAIFILFIAITQFLGSFGRKILYVVLFCVMWMLIEIVLVFIFILLGLEIAEYGMLPSVITNIIMIMLVTLLSIWMKKKNNKNMSLKYTGMLFMLPVGSIFIAHNIVMLGLEVGRDSRISIISFTILMVINIIIFEVYEKLSVSLEIEKERFIFEQQLELVSKHVQEQKKIMRDFREIQHNLTNQLIGIKRSIEQGQSEEAIKILDELMNESDISSKSISFSNNDVVDAVINYKYSVASSNDIEFRTKIFIPEELPISQRDLCVILGNALDNAIEAVKKCCSNRYIHISIGVKKGAFIIVVRNPYTDKIKVDAHGNIMTTKGDKKQHGFGIGSIEKAADRYQGQVIIETENDIFSMTVILSL